MAYSTYSLRGGSTDARVTASGATGSRQDSGGSGACAAVAAEPGTSWRYAGYVVRWPWKRRGVDPEATAAVERSVQAREAIRDQWQPVLEVADEMRALRERNHFADRLAHAYAAQPAPESGVTMRRRKDDK